MLADMVRDAERGIAGVPDRDQLGRLRWLEQPHPRDLQPGGRAFGRQGTLMGCSVDAQRKAVADFLNGGDRKSVV